MIKLEEKFLRDLTVMCIGADMGIYPYEDEGRPSYRERIIEALKADNNNVKEDKEAQE